MRRCRRADGVRLERLWQRDELLHVRRQPLRLRRGLLWNGALYWRLLLEWVTLQLHRSGVRVYDGHLQPLRLRTSMLRHLPRISRRCRRLPVELLIPRVFIAGRCGGSARPGPACPGGPATAMIRGLSPRPTKSRPTRLAAKPATVVKNSCQGAI